MSATLHDTTFGIVEEIDGNQDPDFGADMIGSDDTVNIYHYGAYLNDIGDLPLEEILFRTNYGGDYNPSNIYNTGTKGINAKVFNPVNGLINYLANCRPDGGVDGSGGVAESGGVKTLTPILTGKQASFNERFDSFNDNESIRRSAVGNKIRTITETINGEVRTEPLSCMVISDFQKNVIPTGDALTNQMVPTFPASHDKLYYLDENSIFEWDSNGDQVSYLDELINFTYRVDILNRPVRIDGSDLFPKAIRQGRRIISWTANIKRRSDTSIFDDYEDYKLNGNQRDLNFRIYDEGGTYYKDFEFFDNAINVKMNAPLTKLVKFPVYSVFGLATTYDMDIYDPLSATTFYGETA